MSLCWEFNIKDKNAGKCLFQDKGVQRHMCQHHSLYLKILKQHAGYYYSSIHCFFSFKTCFFYFICCRRRHVGVHFLMLFCHLISSYETQNKFVFFFFSNSIRTGKYIDYPIRTQVAKHKLRFWCSDFVGLILDLE